jgi:hypothetical protein
MRTIKRSRLADEPDLPSVADMLRARRARVAARGGFVTLL